MIIKNLMNWRWSINDGKRYVDIGDCIGIKHGICDSFVKVSKLNDEYMECLDLYDNQIKFKIYKNDIKEIEF